MKFKNAMGFKAKNQRNSEGKKYNLAMSTTELFD